jgi:Ca2+-binding RTX toxin-like protein
MSKSQNTNTNHQGRLVLALMAGGLVASCGGGSQPWTVDPDGFDGLDEESFPLLANPCTITAGTSTMALSVRGAETLYLSLRAADGKVVADGQIGGVECAVPSTYKIAITQDGAHPGIQKVFLDYINGPFALGSASGPGITIALGAGSSLVVRGSIGADKIYLGSTYTTAPVALQHSWINVNGDASADVQFDGVTDVKISTGVGADIISADGGNGTSTGSVALDSTIAFSAYGGPDNDTLTGGKGPSLLDGGDGDDKFIQTATIAADTIVGGKGFDTVDYSSRLVSVNVTLCSAGSCAVTDACGCAAADVTCKATPDATQIGCIATAGINQGTCNTQAGLDQTACNNTADGDQTACEAPFLATKTSCDGTANGTWTTCTGACTPGDTTCTDPCDATLASDLAACLAPYSAAIVPCTTQHTTDVAACTTQQTTDVAACAATHTGDLAACQTVRDATCDGLATSCQATCATPLCSVCIADDGAANEHDTVNDDVEIVLGGKASDTISAQYAVCSNAAAIPTVLCTLKGNEGNDIVIGSAHNDLIDGGAGDDLLQGGPGNDTLIGGAGIDTVTYAERTNPVKVSLDATRLWAPLQNGEVGENDSIASDIENLTGGGGDDFLRGNASANIIHGGPGNDTIEGGAGNDALYGDAGDDKLYGGTGDDHLVGGAGADRLYGGDGNDLLDASDLPAFADLVIDCDGVNDSLGAPSGTQGTDDFLTVDGSDPAALRCEINL